ncbi:MAG: CTP synthase, partial [Parachlamydiaceae bacterium]
AIRQFRNKYPKDCVNIHLTYVPYLRAAGEVKTKPSQHSVQQLREIGIFPDIVLCRCEMSLSDDVKDKLALYCNVPREAVIDEVDVKHSIYEVPLELHEQKLDRMVCKLLGITEKNINLSDWEKIIHSLKNPKGTITLALVGKYVQHQDAYKSVIESLKHAAIAAGYALDIKQFEAEKVESNKDILEEVKGCDGYLIPGGFGERGWMGKIAIAKYCREKKVPYFGICLGMQVMSVEFARHVLKLADANSTEIDPQTTNPVISMLSEQRHVQDLGGTMRLGNYNCALKPGTHAYQAYGKNIINERHRHRFEFNNDYKEAMEKEGFVISGTLEGGSLCEIVEVKDHPWMVGVQFHPEFKSKPTAPHPLFSAFVQAMINHKTKQ